MHACAELKRMDADDDVPASRRCERLFIQGVEGGLLSRGDEARADARVVRRATAHRRDQQHVLSDTEAIDARSMGGNDAREFPLRDQAPAANHPYLAPQERDRWRAARLPV